MLSFSIKSYSAWKQFQVISRQNSPIKIYLFWQHSVRSIFISVVFNKVWLLFFTLICLYCEMINRLILTKHSGQEIIFSSLSESYLGLSAGILVKGTKRKLNYVYKYYQTLNWRFCLKILLDITILIFYFIKGIYKNSTLYNYME